MRLKRKHSILVVLIVSVLPVWAAKNTLPATVVRAWVLPNPVAQADTVCAGQDSAYLNFPMRDMLYDYSICNHYNGNLVSPVESAIYFKRTNTTNSIFGKQYNPYTITPQDVKFYNTTTPYSSISYKKGFTTYHEDNDLHFMFTGNLSPHTNLGTELNYVNAAGHYKNQSGKVVNGSVFGSYNGNHYSIQAAFTFASLSNFENGGLTDMESLKNVDLQSSDLPVNLYGMSGFRYLSGYINHYYSICVERPDTIQIRERDAFGQWQVRDSARVLYIPVTTFRHVLDINEQVRRYLEKSPQAFYTDYFRNPSQTNDSSAVLNIRNTLSVTFEESFNQKLKFGITAYAINEFQRYLLAVAPEEGQWQDSLYNYKWTNNTWVGGEISKKQGRNLRYAAGGDVCLAGYKLGDFQVHGNVDLGWRLGKDSMTVQAYASFHGERPEYYLQHYLSNHYRWDNEFKSVYTLHVGGQVAYPTRWVQPALKIDYANITNHIYFEGLGNPTQCEQNISVLAADLQLNVTTPWVNLDNSVVYQYSSSYTMPLPTIALYSNLYYHGTWFKALEAQIGVDLKYNTAYYAPYLNAATGQFCVQQEVKVGNYPMLSAYANFYVRLLRLRFFAQYQHWDASFAGREYFILPYYPMNPGVFRAGLAFHFNK